MWGSFISLPMPVYPGAFDPTLSWPQGFFCLEDMEERGGAKSDADFAIIVFVAF